MYGIVMVPIPKQMVMSENTDAFTLPGYTCRATARPGEANKVPTLYIGDLGAFGVLSDGRLPTFVENRPVSILSDILICGFISSSTMSISSLSNFFIS